MYSSYILCNIYICVLIIFTTVKKFHKKILFSRWLTLENNHITEIPSTFANLTNLAHLNMKNNLLKQFPIAIGNMMNLKYCFLNCNSIDNVIDEHLEKTKFMKMLDINDNPFPDENLNFKV